MDLNVTSTQDIDCIKKEFVKEDEISNSDNDFSFTNDEKNDTSSTLASKILKIDLSYRPKIKSTTIIDTKSKVKIDDIVKVQKRIKLNLAEDSEYTYDENLVRYRKKTEDEKIVSKKNSFTENIKISNRRFNTCTGHLTSNLHEIKKPEVLVTFSSIRTEFIFSESEEENDENYESNYKESDEKDSNCIDI